MGANSGITWTDNTQNFWMSCTKISEGCKFCLDPGTRIMMLDGSWKPLSEVTVGDQLAGCSELGEGSKTPATRLIKPTTVEAVWITQSNTVTIDFESGRSITCSPNHRFLIKTFPSGKTRWLEAEKLDLLTSVLAFGNPDTAMPLSDQYLFGYLAGATAGDGTMRIAGSGKNGTKQSYWRIAMLEDDKPAMERILRALEILGIESEIKPFSSTSVAQQHKYRTMIKIEHRSMDVLLKIADCLVEVDSNEWMAGWLGGFLDTDGAASGSIRSGKVTHRWSQAKNRNDYLQRTEKYLKRLGVECQLETSFQQRCDTVRLVVKNVNERFQAIGIVRPALYRKGTKLAYGAHLGQELDRVTGIKRGETQNLIDITTSTRTFIAEGLVTHNCYAEDMMDKRYGKVKWGDNGTRVRTQATNWKKPFAWNKQAAVSGKKVRVFTASLSDFFEEREELAPWRAEALSVIASTPNLLWLVLTKRPQHVNAMLEAATGQQAADWLSANPHVWIGTSIENQKRADERIPHLLGIPTRNRFISAEPLLEQVNLKAAYTGHEKAAWTIIGGESGQGARPMRLDWVHNMLDDAVSNRIPVFFKQTGVVLAKELGLKHKKGEDPHEWSQFSPYLTQRFPQEFYPLAGQAVNE